MINSDALLTELTWQVLIVGYLTSLLTFGLRSLEHDFLGSQSLSPVSNAKLGQSGRHQSRSQKVACSILTGGTFFTEIILHFST